MKCLNCGKTLEMGSQHWEHIDQRHVAPIDVCINPRPERENGDCLEGDSR